MPRSLAITAHADIQGFLNESPVAQDLLRALHRKDIAIVPPEEGTHKVEAHADMGAYLKGRTLHDAIHGGPAPASEPTTSSGAPAHNRRRPG